MVDAPEISDGVLHPLDPRIIPLQQIGGWITTGVLAAVTLVFVVSTWVAAGPTVRGLAARLAIWLAAVALAGLLAHRWPVIAYRHASYRVDPLGIEIRRGVFWRSILKVPRSRVQHTDVSQGPLERRFGLGTLVIYTAGTDHARVSLGGLEHGRALRIREHLMPAEGTDAV